MNMVGDYLGGFVTIATAGSRNGTQVCPLPGGAIPRFKMAEDTSPMPTDRGYFIYDYYGGVPYNGVAAGNSINLTAFTPGFEKTFLDGAMSVEVRLPMASTLNNTIFWTEATRNGRRRDRQPGRLRSRPCSTIRTPSPSRADWRSTAPRRLPPFASAKAMRPFRS